jgi:hypothetical protein
VIEALGSDYLHPALGKRIRTRCPHRRANGLDMCGPENLVECSGDLGITVPDLEADGSLRLFRVADEAPDHLGHPLAVRIRGDTEEVDDPTLDVDDEQDAVPPIHRVDVEKSVASMLCALGAEELRPVRSLPGPSRRQPVAATHVAHGRNGDRDTELAQFAHDSELASAGILRCQSTDQVDVLIGYRRMARALMRIAPTLPDDLPLPAQHGRRRHDHDRPPAVGKEPTGKGEVRPSSPSEPGDVACVDARPGVDGGAR